MTEQQQERRDDTGALVVRKESSVSVSQPDVERIETFVTIPANFQYEIAGKKGEPARLALTSDGYDYINRSLGATFFLPDWVPDEKGDLVRNPIHRPDYIYMRMGAVWRTDNGQLVGATEDLEVDFKMTYQQARLDSWDSEVALDDNGQPIFGPDGTPLIRVKGDNRLSAAEKERKAMQTLMQLRTMGLRYAQTVLRTRLLKVATGIKSLPNERGQGPRRLDIRVIGWRDQMTPTERIEEASKAMHGLFAGGRPADLPSLSAEEMRAIERDPEPDETLGTQSDRERFEEMTEGDKQEALSSLDVTDMTEDEMREAIEREYAEMKAQ